jgi:hypothetical protein
VDIPNRTTPYSGRTAVMARPRTKSRVRASARPFATPRSPSAWAATSCSASERHHHHVHGGGTFAGDKLTKGDFHISYYIPAMRMFLEGTHPNGMAFKEIRVFADTFAWNETKEGMGATAAMNTLNDRAPLLKLTPFGALWSVIEAEGHTVVTTVGGKTVLTGTSPLDGIEVSTTLDDQHRPVQVTAKANGHIYGATFADYRDTWEPKYLFIFPSRLTWTLDGKPLADLQVTAFKSNPYVVFPVPAVVGQRTSN